MTTAQMFLFDDCDRATSAPVPLRLVRAEAARPKKRNGTAPFWEQNPQAWQRSDRKAWRAAKLKAQFKASIAREVRKQAVGDEELLATLNLVIGKIVGKHAWGWRDKEELRAEIFAQIFRRARRWQPGKGKTLKEYCAVLARFALRTLAQKAKTRPKIDPDQNADWLAASEAAEHEGCDDSDECDA